MSKDAASTSLSLRHAAPKQTEAERRQLECAKALMLSDECYGREQSDQARRIKAAAWAMALEDIPVSEIVTLMQAELKARINPFPPIPAELIARYSGVEFTKDDDGNTEKYARANVSAYLPLQPTPHELEFKAEIEARKALPAPVDENDPYAGMTVGQRAVQRFIDERAAAKRMARPRAERPAPDPSTRTVPTDDATLRLALRTWGHMETWRVPPETSAAFGWWLLEQLPVSQWSLETVRAKWAEWKGTHVQQKEMTA